MAQRQNRRLFSPAPRLASNSQSLTPQLGRRRDSRNISPVDSRRRGQILPSAAPHLRHHRSSSVFPADRSDSRDVSIWLDSLCAESIDRSSPLLDGNWLPWGPLPRQASLGYSTSPANKAVMKSVTDMLRGTLVTGYHSQRCSPWAYAYERYSVMKLMRGLWVELGCRAGIEVADEPVAEEAKKV